MRTLVRVALSAVLAVPMAVWFAVPVGAAPPAGTGGGWLSSSYAAVDLGSLGGRDTRAWSVNDRGVAVGYSETAAGTRHGFIWSNGVMTDLGTLGGDSSEAVNLNDLGQVVGRSQTPGGAWHAFRWWGGVMTDLGTLGGDSSEASMINTAGQILGHSATPGGATHAFRWSQGRMVDLGTLGGRNTVAYSMNNRGEIVGTSDLGGPGYSSSGFVWRNGTMTALRFRDGSSAWPIRINDLGHVLTSGDSRTSSSGVGIFLWRGTAVSETGLDGNYPADLNQADQVAGTYETPDRVGHAAIWQAGTRRNLPVPAGWFSGIFAINDWGVVLGGASADYTPQSVVWNRHGMVVVPALPGYDIWLPDDFNNRNDVLAYGRRGDDTGHALLWTVARTRVARPQSR